MEQVCIGVDVGGTNLRLAFTGRDGTVLGRLSEATGGVSGCAPFLARLVSAVARVKAEAEAGGRRVAAVGVGIPGLVSGDGVIRSSVSFSALEGVNLARELSHGIGLPVLVQNDANACAIGEQRLGAGRGYGSWLMVTIGTGVGAALVLNGKLWTGADGLAGEFGHVTVDPEGRPCGCGNRGCLEQYASATAIADGNGGSAAVARRALLGDADALARFEGAGRHLGLAAAGVLNLLNLEAIILGGGGAESFELLAPPMRREIAARALVIAAGRVCIEKGALGADAGVVGAATAAFETLAQGI